VGACRQLSFSSGDDNVLAADHNSNEDPGTSKSRTNEKKLGAVKKDNNVKRSQKVIVSPVKHVLVKRTPKAVDRTKMKSRVDKQVGKSCSPVLSFLASLTGTCAARPLSQVLLVRQTSSYSHLYYSDIAENPYERRRIAHSFIMCIRR
jgi:hypothetical protein